MRPRKKQLAENSEEHNKCFILFLFNEVFTYFQNELQLLRKHRQAIFLPRNDPTPSGETSSASRVTF